VKVAIAGIGNIGRRHLDTLAGLPGIDVAAVADPRFGSARPPVIPALPAFASYEEMLATVPVDAVVLCSPSGLHATQSVLAAENGIHVIAEKPIATTMADADAVLDACARSNVHLAVLHQYRFSPPIIALKRVMQSDALGDLVFLNISINWRRSREYYHENGGWRGTWDMDGGGALMNQGAHAVDLARWLGGPIASVMSYTTNVVHDIEAEDTACVSLQFVHGGLGTLQVTTCADTNHPALIRVQGTTAFATLAGNTLVVNGELSAADQFSPPARPTQPHRDQFLEIFRAMSQNGTPPITGYDARETLAATMAMYESARKGALVEVIPRAVPPGGV
jgi:UDP-N-acetyl-2-amino-2-deoxyglucuronate dehydrogenase